MNEHKSGSVQFSSACLGSFRINMGAFFAGCPLSVIFKQIVRLPQANNLDSICCSPKFHPHAQWLVFNR
jgi:hypothetical protein